MSFLWCFASWSWTCSHGWRLDSMARGVTIRFSLASITGGLGQAVLSMTEHSKLRAELLNSDMLRKLERC